MLVLSQGSVQVENCVRADLYLEEVGGLMNFPGRLSRQSDQDLVAGARSKNDRKGAGIVACLGVICALVFSALLFSQSKPDSQLGQPPKAVSSESSTKALTDAQMSRMSSDELAKYLFEQHGCKNCHTLGANGRLGLTERGKEIGKNFEGCISLLISMNLIAEVKDADRTQDEKRKAARFQEFGCTTCHQIITPGKMGLTGYGAKLKSLHMACTDVEKLLSRQR
jgi:cytochrome c551/c552